MKTNELSKLLSKSGFTDKINDYIKLSGDASSREYFRIFTNNNSFIVSKEPAGGLQNIDFKKTSILFEKYLRTPKVIFTSDDATILVQEDVGDTSLQQYICTKTVNERIATLKEVVDEIHKYQKISIKEFKKYSSYEFDKDKLEFEFDLANEYLVEKYLETNISKETLEETKRYLLDYFLEHKDVVCHRDYHSKNIMVKDNKLINIDYQDSRIGPRCYDLVSFLEDCYFDYGDIIKDELKKYFFEKSDFDTYAEFIEEYELVKIQRLFKALGSFTYLKIAKDKPSYEKYIGRTFENLRITLENNKMLKPFSQAIIRAYYESK